MKVSRIIIVVLFFVIFSWVITKGLIFYGEKLVYAYFVPAQAEFNVEMSDKKNAERYFSIVPFVVKPSFEKFVQNTENSYQRRINCIVFLTSQNETWTFNELSSFLNSDDPAIRNGAVSGLAVYSQAKSVLSVLSNRWKKELDDRVLISMGLAFCKYGNDSKDELIDGLNNSCLHKRIVSLEALLVITRKPHYSDLLKNEYKKEAIDDRRFLVMTSVIFLKSGSIPILKMAMKDSDSKINEFAIKHYKELSK